ncbi:MAG: DinB family protein [Mucilaginibacter sp.]
MNTGLLNELNSTESELIKALEIFDDSNINTVPFEGSWTGGQVAEHILKSLSFVAETVSGQAKSTERNPEEHIKQLSDIFLNMDIKMKSPDFIIPTNEPKNKEALTLSLKKKLDAIKEVAETKDLSETCTLFEMPGLGPLTRVEFISFAIFHTKRHTNQLNTILKHL